ncbi:MAG: hypothetical protein A2568_03635 [Candidatus Yanofskybacteria bacterium RIFOXYD1_FULL_44_17]|uniref:Peptidase M16 domain-containing protein n=1 Tax=Candidatus Yanofskybacteria bacterium GW2011_GWE2_40_11 TaxID=1619033 RepID=A0A0G0T0V9_9BACT|nr:MAG: Peptidase M16 domain-containing protein [Candidatus Yanofskybacteria bacterium GW2011_GWE1_40_10]KKR40760.1 MAG: Peptidase M16 domain-containing protein [Candidatus Yanofskybacteria bacterium GW2011_GWE2_40_11]KKT15970.1 MAG: Peptidase M16 domain-containing protein [Candidatus Yanofskybacteria bacterium GW2011_GWF2_43_596]OGN36041.1 MAG: hypothetical protein A2207_03215 [Candidatus Yanofskybacteria bacterium RIFOXYA1_FULL_44_17]OGN36357.1 MAG: hypothetical protein A2241_01270 [Candidatu
MRLVIPQELDNGAMVYSQYDPTSSTHLGATCVRAGSIYDPQGNVSGKRPLRGLAHLVEHMKGRESKKYSVDDVYKIIHIILGGLSACDISVDHVCTTFGTTMVESKGNLIKALDMFFSLLKDGILSEDGLSIEKAAINQESALTGSSPGDLLQSSLYKAVYTSNPIRHPIDGYMNEVETATLADVRAFVRRYYVARNMFFVALGPDKNTALELGSRYLKFLPNGSQPILDYDHSDDFPRIGSTRSNVEVMPMPDNMRHHLLAVGFPTETYFSEDGLALDILAEILKYRLIILLREANRIFRNGVYHTPVDTDRSFVHGLIVAEVASRSEEYIKYCETIILQEFARLREELVSKEVFEGFRSAARFQPLVAFKSYPDILAHLIMAAAANGDKDMKHLNSFKERFARVTRNSLRNVANKYFTKEYVRVLIRPA